MLWNPVEVHSFIFIFQNCLNYLSDLRKTRLLKILMPGQCIF